MKRISCQQLFLSGNFGHGALIIFCGQGQGRPWVLSTLVPPRPASLWRIFSHLVQFHLRRAHCHLSLFTQCSEITSPCAGIRPGKVDCFLQHTLKIGSQSHQYVFALADWYVEDENRTNMASPLKLGEKHFFLEAHHGIFQWPEFFPNLLLHLHLKTKLS